MAPLSALPLSQGGRWILPSFNKISEILEGVVNIGSFIHVVGLVKDSRSPIKTGGKGGRFPKRQHI
jgi:hypothetical protein